MMSLPMEKLLNILNDFTVSFPMLSVFLLAGLMVGVAVIARPIAELIKKNNAAAACRRRKEQFKEKAQKVLQTSSYLRAIHTIGKDFSFEEKIPNGGTIEYGVLALSKAEYDRTDTKDLLERYIEKNILQLSLVLKHVEANRRTANDYRQKIELNKRYPEPSVLESIGLCSEEYVAIEEKIAQKMMIPIVTELRIKCELSYSSPQGRNRYAKSDIFEESEIRVAIQDLEKKRIERQSESFQKKEERGKMNDGLRYNILRRDGFRCRLCGRTAQDGVKLEVDHIIPISRGGKTTYDNLQTLCKECNRGKGAKMDDNLKEV